MLKSIKFMQAKTFFFLSIFMFLLTSCNQQPERKIEVRGVYGHPQPLWDKDYKLADLGINSIFVHSGSINQKMMNRARAEGMNVYAEFATLNGKNYVEEHPEAWAINEKGEQVEAASWFMGVCPTEPGFREYRFGLMRELLKEYDIDGVWMDYVHWHAQFEEPEPILPETCFCDHCLASFSKDTGLEIPEGNTPQKAEWILKHHDPEWRDWRCKVILDWTVEIRNIINEVKPGILLGIYHCPWTDEEFDGARRRILGLDYDLLRDFFDVFSPMVYHARMGREPVWVQENIAWFNNRMNIENGGTPKVWPIVQAYNNPYTVSASEFETVLKGGLTSNSSGVMMFTTRAMADDEEKIAVMKNIYKNQD
ncbi:family 10 glycosylhydrolase [Mariniphaga sp.]|uniref:family 10 glycosylhydrolase n=1 Tax=Mariniphaga sp. TaxID=1954475 RepID=UPI00356812EB